MRTFLFFITKNMKEGKEFIDYILTGEQKPLTWQLRQPVLVDYEGKGLRKIVYVAGSNSILESQNEGLKTTPITFVNGKVRVKSEDVVQNKFIALHPEFDIKFKVLDPEADAEEALEWLELQEAARDKIRSADVQMLQAVAVILFGAEAYAYQERQAKLKCFDYADNQPIEMIQLLDDPKTQVRYLAALSFSRGLIITNIQKTAVLWEDNGKQIIPLAKGETAVEKMADFLYDSKNSTTLQEISKRVEKLEQVS